MNPLKALRTLVFRGRIEAEMAEEMREHIDRRVEQSLAAGMAPDEARAAALRAFGGVEQAKERCREQRAGLWLEQLGKDFRYALRQLMRAPAFAAVAVLSLALGIGASTLIFSLVNEFLLRSLPVRAPEELVLFRNFNGARGGGMALWSEGNSQRDPISGQMSGTSFSLRMFERFQEPRAELARVFAFAPIYQLNLLVGGQPALNVLGQYVSGNYHAALGIGAFLGRPLTPEDDRPGAVPTAVISHRCWASRFQCDPNVLGRTIHLNKVAVTIIGVTPPGFDGAMQAGESADVSIALALAAQIEPELKSTKSEPWCWWLRVMGRLAPGATAAQARAALEPTFRAAAREGWETGQMLADEAARTMPDLPSLGADPGARGENDTRQEHASSLQILMGFATLVLAAACANVANLLLARGAARRREIALRLALGASRGRIVRQLLTEALLLALLGAALGTALAWGGRGLLLALRPFGETASVLDLPLDAQVLGFATATAAVTALLFGIAPAVRATRLDLTAEFHGGARALGVGARSRLSRLLMVAQIALSFVLLVSSGLFIRTLRNLQAVDPGYNPRGLTLFRVEASAAGYSEAQFTALHARIRERLEKMPSVLAVTYSRMALLSQRSWTSTLSFEGLTPPPGAPPDVYTNSLAPNFLATMGIPLVLGRGFTDGDGAFAPKVAIINQTLARQYFGLANPIGRRLTLGSGTRADAAKIEVIGVARDAHYTSLRDDVPPTVYFPALQSPASGASFAVRAAGDPTTLLPALRSAVREIDPSLPLLGLRTQEEQLDLLHAQEHFFARLSGCFGLVAVALAGVGLYGLMSYSVLRRTGEIGLRIAIGAFPRNVLAMILREALALAAVGVLLGLAVATASGRLVAAMLFGLSPVDPLTYGAVGLALLGIAFFAAFIPAHWASRVDPMTALRPD